MNTFSVREAISTGWQLTKKYFIISLGLILAFGVVSWLLSFLGERGDAIGWIAQLVNLVISIAFSMGMIRITVDALGGEEPRFGAFKDVFSRFLPYFGVSILVSIFALVPFIIIFGIGVVIIGGSFIMGDFDAIFDLWWLLLLAMLPAVYVSIRMFFAPYLVVDGNKGVMESIKMSWNASAPMQGKIFLFYVVSLLIGLLGLVCFFVGIFVSILVIMYAQAYVYRMAFPPATPELLLVDEVKVTEVVD